MAVLSPIEGHYDLVYAYVAADTSDPWKRFDPMVPVFANDLVSIDETMGLLVHATDAVVWWVPGTDLAEVSIPLEVGWNLVGYPWTEAQPIADALESIAGKFSLVYTYDESGPEGPWRTYEPDAPLGQNDLTEMRPGEGYWIEVTQACEWSGPGTYPRYPLRLSP